MNLAWNQSSSISQRIIPIMMGIVAALWTVACTRGNNMVDREGASNKLSEIDVSSPSQAEFREAFGPNCEKVKLTTSVPTTDDHCQRVKDLLANFRLTIKQSDGTSCRDGSSSSPIEVDGSFSQKSISQRVSKGCDYDLLLEVGIINAGKLEVLVSNQKSRVRLVKRESLESGKAKVSVNLEPTALGISRGFPELATLSGQQPDASDLAIDISFGNTGKKSSPKDPSQTGDTSQSSPSSPSGQLPPQADVTPPKKGNQQDLDDKMKSGDGINPQQQPKSAFIPNGKYQLECSPIPFAVSQYHEVDVLVQGNSIKTARVVTSDPTCRDPIKRTMEQHSVANYTLTSRETGELDAFNIDLDITSNQIELTTEQGVAKWNKQKSCGIDSWQINRKTEVASLSQIEPACNADLGTVFRKFDIIKLSPDRGIQVGKKLKDAGQGMIYILGTKSDNRPTEWGRILTQRMDDK
jgi:hypothetical protein